MSSKTKKPKEDDSQAPNMPFDEALRRMLRTPPPTNKKPKSKKKPA